MSLVDRRQAPTIHPSLTNKRQTKNEVHFGVVVLVVIVVVVEAARRSQGAASDVDGKRPVRFHHELGSTHATGGRERGDDG